MLGDEMSFGIPGLEVRPYYIIPKKSALPKTSTLYTLIDTCRTVSFHSHQANIGDRFFGNGTLFRLKIGMMAKRLHRFI